VQPSLLRAFVALMVAAAPLATASELPDQAPANPALWHVHGHAGELYLFGSVHLLPPEVVWQKGAVESAIERANVFVFEIPANAMSQLPLAKLVADKGILAKGDSLHAMLTKDEQAELDADCTLAGMSPEMIDHMRPWLAQLALLSSQLEKANARFETGVDVVLQTRVEAEHREVRFLETIDEQTALIIPADPRLELSEFVTELKSFKDEGNAYSAIVAAWESGDVHALEKITDDEFRDEPEARKALIDERNHAWLPKLERMLNENKIFFVAVGEGHLIGPGGVPALLRADGYDVTGP